MNELNSIQKSVFRIASTVTVSNNHVTPTHQHPVKCLSELQNDSTSIIASSRK